MTATTAPLVHVGRGFVFPATRRDANTHKRILVSLRQELHKYHSQRRSARTARIAGPGPGLPVLVGVLGFFSVQSSSLHSTTFEWYLLLKDLIPRANPFLNFNCNSQSSQDEFTKDICSKQTSLLHLTHFRHLIYHLVYNHLYTEFSNKDSTAR